MRSVPSAFLASLFAISGCGLPELSAAPSPDAGAVLSTGAGAPWVGTLPSDFSVVEEVCDADGCMVRIQVDVAGTATPALQTREFLYFMPDAVWASGAARPVVFMFHGTGGDGDRFFNISGWREKAVELAARGEGFSVVFPTAMQHIYGPIDSAGVVDPITAVRKTKWTDGKIGVSDDQRLAACSPCPPAASWCPGGVASSDTICDDPATGPRDPYDMQFVDAIVTGLAPLAYTDPNRFYAAGFSNGANFVSRLAMERSDVFAAFHIAAGGLVQAGSFSPTPRRIIQSLGECEMVNEVADFGHADCFLARPTCSSTTGSATYGMADVDWTTFLHPGACTTGDPTCQVSDLIYQRQIQPFSHVLGFGGTPAPLFYRPDLFPIACAPPGWLGGSPDEVWIARYRFFPGDDPTQPPYDFILIERLDHRYPNPSCNSCNTARWRAVDYVWPRFAAETL